MAVIRRQPLPQDEIFFSRWSHPKLSLSNYCQTVHYMGDEKESFPALSNRPLKPVEMFRVVVLDVKEDETDSAFEIGFSKTTKAFDSSSHRETGCYLKVCSKEHKLFRNGELVCNLYEWGHQKHKVGSVYSICKKLNGDVVFFINGYYIGTIKTDEKEDLHGFCSVSRFTTGVTLA